MTEQECRALFCREAYVLASSEPEMYRGFKLGLKIGAATENEAAIEDARTVGGEAGAEMEKLIRARREQ